MFSFEIATLEKMLIEANEQAARCSGLGPLYDAAMEKMLFALRRLSSVRKLTQAEQVLSGLNADGSDGPRVWTHPSVVKQVRPRVTSTCPGGLSAGQ